MNSPDFDPDQEIQEDQAMATRPVEKDIIDNAVRSAGSERFDRDE